MNKSSTPLLSRGVPWEGPNRTLSRPERGPTVLSGAPLRLEDSRIIRVRHGGSHLHFCRDQCDLHQSPLRDVSSRRYTGETLVLHRSLD